MRKETEWMLFECGAGTRWSSTSEDYSGKMCPASGTYGREAAIVDGDNGRTYLIQRAAHFNFINVWGSDFKTVVDCPSVFPEDADRYAELNQLINEAKGNYA